MTEEGMKGSRDAYDTLKQACLRTMGIKESNASIHSLCFWHTSMDQKLPILTVRRLNLQYVINPSHNVGKSHFCGNEKNIFDFPHNYGWARKKTSDMNRQGISKSMEESLEHICEKHDELVKQLADVNSALSTQDLAKLGKEASELESIVENVREWKRLRRELEEVISLCSVRSIKQGSSTVAVSEDVDQNISEEDRDFIELAMEERAQLEARLPDLEQSLMLSLLPKDTADSRGVVLEVRAGTGGEEACLFAGELFRMYERYASMQGWKFEVAEFSASDLGGCKLASATISSPSNESGVFGKLKFESGVHRVQRVPATESGGRVHTSAASVAVLPVAEEVDIQVRDEDLRIDVYRAGGAGGQHVNTTNSAVRITHIPTGITVSIQDERSQHKNKAKAMTVLRTRLFDAEKRRVQAAASSARKALIGSGDRSERIRTYNFPQGRITDHRIGLTEHDIQSMMDGNKLNIFIEALQVEHQTELLHSSY